MHATMYQKIWKEEHLANLPEPIPVCVLQEVQTVIETLNHHYGSTRDADKDLGGYIAVFSESYLRADYERLLSHYHLTDTDREYIEILYQDEQITWIEELFLCSSDYHLIIIRPEKRKKTYS